MNITPIKMALPKINTHVKNQKNIQTQYQNSNKINAYPKEYYLSFSGGKSLDLKKTIKQIADENFPPDIKQLAQDAIDNHENVTLCDIHTRKYEGLLDCENLEEIKLMYPEFEDVISADDIKDRKGSNINKIKKGEVDIIDKDSDISTQLIQLYWGLGFSINDIKEKTNGVDILNTMEKLNIPRMKPIYARYLKLSDINYNQRFSEEMSKRLTGISKKRSNHEPKKRGPLTQEHKDSISKSLQKFYQEHPEAIFDRKKVKKKMTLEERETLKEVLLRTWGYHELNSVRKALTKKLKRKVDIEPSEVTEMMVKEDTRMEDFWRQNPWAKDKLKNSMVNSWERQHKLAHIGLITEPVLEINYIPNKMKEELYLFYPKELVDETMEWQIYTAFDRIPVYLPNKHKKSEITTNFFMLLETADFKEKWFKTLDLTNMIFLNNLVKKGHIDIFIQACDIMQKDNGNANSFFFSILKSNKIPVHLLKTLEGILNSAWDIKDNEKKTESIKNEFSYNIIKYGKKNSK